MPIKKTERCLQCANLVYWDFDVDFSNVRDIDCIMEPDEVDQTMDGCPEFEPSEKIEEEGQ